MIVLGLDIATKTGWSIVGGQAGNYNPLAWGTLDLSPAVKDEPDGVRFHRMYVQLQELIDGREPINVAAIEESFIRGRAATRVLYGLIAVALVVLEEHGIDYAFVDNNVWKKDLVGTGKATKEQARAALNGWGQITPATEISEDESDALSVARWIVPSLIEERGVTT